MEIYDQYDLLEVKEKIRRGIEENRMGGLSLTVRRADGTPLSGASVKLTQTRHAFRFGANLFLLGEMETEEKNAAFRENFKEIFNLGVVPIYWDALEPVRGKPRFSLDSERIYRRPPVDRCIAFCEENGIEPKAHCLNYEPFIPDWVKELDEDGIRQALEERMAALAECYADKIPCWEVINEMCCDRSATGTALYNDPDVVAWSFKAARKYFPRNELIINEDQGHTHGHFYEKKTQYRDLIAKALASGAKIDGVGMQGHMMWCRKESGLPEVSLGVFDWYHDQFGLPTQVTEVTIPSVFDGVIDEERQAEMLTKLYSAWFSAKSNEAIIYWNLTDGYAHRAEPGDMTKGENVYRGGLVTFDAKRKPAYKALSELVNRTWRTNAVLTADEAGKVGLRAFYGDYRAEISCGGRTEVRTFRFTKDSGEASVTL